MSPTGMDFRNDGDLTVGTITLAPGATLITGQILCYDVTNIPSSATADNFVKPSAAVASTLSVGVFQDKTITNAAAFSQQYLVTVLIRGYGQVYVGAAAGGTAVTVGGSLIMAILTTVDYAVQGAGASNRTIGTACATGAATAFGASLVAVPGTATNNATINAFIYVR